ncbi:hypothetical protein COCC4DRAFT_30832, partial [Bipolaris maydis ATCC 48331]
MDYWESGNCLSDAKMRIMKGSSTAAEVTRLIEQHIIFFFISLFISRLGEHSNRKGGKGC